jgi:hypothetical protein
MGDHDLAIVTRIIIFLSSASFLNFILPVSFQFITLFSLATFVGTTTAVAGACVISTGLVCAAALGLSAVLNLAASGILAAIGIDLSHVPILSSLTSTSPYAWIGSLILIPISLILSVYISKLARGQ